MEATEMVAFLFLKQEFSRLTRIPTGPQACDMSFFTRIERIRIRRFFLFRVFFVWFACFVVPLSDASHRTDSSAQKKPNHETH